MPLRSKRINIVLGLALLIPLYPLSWGPVVYTRYAAQTSTLARPMDAVHGVLRSTIFYPCHLVARAEDHWYGRYMRWWRQQGINTARRIGSP